MDDPIFKSKYDKYKHRVKLWEHDFKKKYNRIPSKHDIREAPREIRDSYKMYYKMKTSLLENTLSDVLSEDGFELFSIDNSQGEPSFLSLESNISDMKLPTGLSLLTSSEKPFSNIEDISEKCLSTVINVNENHIIKEFEAVEILPSNESAWIANSSSKITNVSKKKISPLKQNNLTDIKTNLTEKLSKSISFSKRNPRKSLSRLSSGNLNKTTSNLSLCTSNSSELLPDLETVLYQKAKDKNSSITTNNQFLKSKEVANDVDIGWLNRCGKEIGFESKLERNIENNIISNTNRKYGLSNLNIPKVEITEISSIFSNSVEKKFENNSDEIVSNSEDEMAVLEFRHIVKRRRILTSANKTEEKTSIQENKQNIVSTDNLKKAAEITIANNDVTIIETKIDSNENHARKIKKQKDESSEESDFEKEIKTKSKGRKSRQTKKAVIKKKILNSKESDFNADAHNKSRTRNLRKSTKSSPLRSSPRISKKLSEQEENFNDGNPEDMKYELPFEIGNLKSNPSVNLDELKEAETVIGNYINSSTKLFLKNDVLSESNSKAEKGRAYIEKKIAQGKLNENFVRIDINKKKFVRGKKTINYSKYKKKLWRDKKKIGALSGPDMNMGGCDGGVLECFTCGQVGHFAQQCKMKGDTLAPYEPDAIDESPFPTLKEAGEMASQQAIVVHSKNIQQLPKASNSNIYVDDKNLENADENSENINEHNDNNSIHNAFDEEFDLDDVENSTNYIVEKPENNKTIYIGHKIPEEFLKQSGLLEKTSENSEIEPLYKVNSDGSTIKTTSEVYQVLKLFGHSNFRKGQDRAIMRILSGQSTLVTLSTGSGKSLCYQLPAYLYSRQRNSITLVISPLVSLMEDQVYGVPNFLRAYCLHTNQTPQQRLKIMEIINSGEIDILLISPEAVVAGERSTGFGSLLRKLPTIAFACIDEAHCVSQWSHNFRPSYLMICKVLQDNLGVKTILGLTATATMPTRNSIIRHLGIKDGKNGIINDIPLPDNLILSVSKDSNRDSALMKLLRSERFDCCQSIIIYCTRRDECERIATYIRTCMQDKKPENLDNKKKRKRINWHAEPYHAGMPSSRRRTIQNAFMKNELRIVVATIAFGMGINKPDIRAVIHYNMPKNIESYVQEIGRAGRDGDLAHCHLFLDSKGSDQNELRRHIYANSIDRHVIRKLLQKVFIACSCNKNLTKSESSNNLNNEIEINKCEKWNADLNHEEYLSNKNDLKKRICPGHEIGISIERTVEQLDIPEENISTLLCYLELDGRYAINVLSNAYTMCKIISYGGAKYLKQAAKNCPPLAMAIALEIKNETFDENNNIIEFSVIEIASAIGWNSGVVKYQLKNLEWIKENNLSRRSPISVNYFNLGFRIRAPGDFLPDEIDNALDSLYNRTVQQEKAQLIQLQYAFNGLSSIGFDTCNPCCDVAFNTEKSDKLKQVIRDYFENDYPNNMILTEETDNTPEEVILSDCRTMMNMYPDNKFTGRALARIFHGIQSPNFPAVIWGRCKYWRGHTHTNFNRIVKLANVFIVRMRT